MKSGVWSAFPRRQVLDRVVGTITEWATAAGYFEGGSQHHFSDDLREILVRQEAAFNSPVYFNLGCPDRAQQVSACFILPVGDSLPEILDWIKTEGLIFRAAPALV